MWYPLQVLLVSSTFVEVPESPGLIAQAQAGDHEAFGMLCRIHGQRLVRQATLICGDPSWAEDLAQETLFAAWKSRRRFNGRCRYFTWLCAVLLNRYRKGRRRRRPAAATEFSAHDQDAFTELLATVPDAASPPDEAAISLERIVFLRQCVDQLSPKHREVIHLRFYVDHSLEGIAAALDCSVGTVKSRLFHALERLRKMNASDGPPDENRRPWRTP